MEFLIVVTFMVLILILPVKLAAEWLGASNTGTLSCLIALILASAIQKGFALLLPSVDENLGMLIAIPLSGLAYMLVLGTTFLRGMAIAVLQGFLMLLLLMLFAGVLAGLA